jgi:polyhydroxyalkanoate synthesis regulator phasin
MNTEQAKRNIEEMNHKGQEQTKSKEEKAEQVTASKEQIRDGYKMSGLMRLMLTAGVAFLVLRFIRGRSAKKA